MSARPRLAVAALAVVLLAAGCSTSVRGSGTQASPSVVASLSRLPSASAVPSGSRAAIEVVVQARDSLAHVFGFEMTGTLQLGPQRVTVDLVVGPGGGHGTLTAAGVTATLDYNGLSAPPGGTGLYITAPAAYWIRQGFDAADADRYAGQQVSVPTTSPLAAVYVLVDQEGLTSLVFTAAGAVNADGEVRSSPDVDGQPAVVVDAQGDGRSLMTVMTTGQQFPLRLEAPRADLAFSKFGVDPKVTTPSGTPLSLPS